MPALELRIELSSGSYEYRRQTENIWEVLGDIGGFYDILSIGVSFIISFYSQEVFESYVASQQEIDHGSLQKTKSHYSNDFENLFERLDTGRSTRMKKGEIINLGKRLS